MATEKSVPVTEGTGTTDAIATVGITRADSSTAYRQEVVIGDDTTNAARAKVQNGTPGATDYGLTTRTLLYDAAGNPIVQKTLPGARTYRGRANTFRTPGRAGTTGQKIFSIFNASGSTKLVTVNLITIDLVQTVIKAITVIPPVIRAYRTVTLPTNGTAVTKAEIDSSLTSSSSITVLGDASADGTNSTTALTATLVAGKVLAQEFAPRFVTAAGYEPFDRTTFFDGEDEEVVLRALEGIVVMLDYAVTGANPTTDMWVVGCEWSEI